MVRQTRAARKAAGLENLPKDLTGEWRASDGAEIVIENGRLMRNGEVSDEIVKVEGSGIFWNGWSVVKVEAGAAEGYTLEWACLVDDEFNNVKWARTSITVKTHIPEPEEPKAGTKRKRGAGAAASAKKKARADKENSPKNSEPVDLESPQKPGSLEEEAAEEPAAEEAKP